MKRLTVFAILLFTACQQPPKPDTIVKTVIIYDTLVDNTPVLRKRYEIPPDYAVFFDTATRSYYAGFWDGALDRYEYLKDEDVIVMPFSSKRYADYFRHPANVAALIKKHWDEILADRASHPPQQIVVK